MGKTHTKKVFAKYFQQIVDGKKTYEVRLADWKCEEGDKLELIEIDDKTSNPTGRLIEKNVGAVIKTKEIEQLAWWSKHDTDMYGFQVIALTGGSEK